MVFLIGAIAGSIYLVTHPKVFKSRASENGQITILDANGNNIDGNIIKENRIKLRIEVPDWNQPQAMLYQGFVKNAYADSCIEDSYCDGTTLIRKRSCVPSEEDPDNCTCDYSDQEANSPSCTSVAPLAQPAPEPPASDENREGSSLPTVPQGVPDGEGGCCSDATVDCLASQTCSDLNPNCQSGRSCKDETPVAVPEPPEVTDNLRVSLNDQTLLRENFCIPDQYNFDVNCLEVSYADLVRQGNIVEFMVPDLEADYTIRVRFFSNRNNSRETNTTARLVKYIDPQDTLLGQAAQAIDTLNPWEAKICPELSEYLNSEDDQPKTPKYKQGEIVKYEEYDYRCEEGGNWINQQVEEFLRIAPDGVHPTIKQLAIEHDAKLNIGQDDSQSEDEETKAHFKILVRIMSGLGIPAAVPIPENHENNYDKYWTPARIADFKIKLRLLFQSDQNRAALLAFSDFLNGTKWSSPIKDLPKLKDISKDLNRVGGLLGKLGNIDPLLRAETPQQLIKGFGGFIQTGKVLIGVLLAVDLGKVTLHSLNAQGALEEVRLESQDPYIVGSFWSMDSAIAENKYTQAQYDTLLTAVKDAGFAFDDDTFVSKEELALYESVRSDLYAKKVNFGQIADNPESFFEFSIQMEDAERPNEGFNEVYNYLLTNGETYAHLFGLQDPRKKAFPNSKELTNFQRELRARITDKITPEFLADARGTMMQIQAYRSLFTHSAEWNSFIKESAETAKYTITPLIALMTIMYGGAFTSELMSSSVVVKEGIAVQQTVATSVTAKHFSKRAMRAVAAFLSKRGINRTAIAQDYGAKGMTELLKAALDDKPQAQLAF